MEEGGRWRECPLPQNVVEAKTLSDIKKKLDIALGAKRIEGYGGKGGSGYRI